MNRVTGDYVCFLDDDDVWTPQHLSTFAEVISEARNIDVFKTGIIVQRDGQEIFLSSFLEGPSKKESLKFLLHDYFSLLDLCIKKEVAQSFEFDDYPLWQDKFYLIPILQRHPIHQIKKRTVLFNEHDGRSVNQAYRQPTVIQEQIKAVNDAFNKYQLNEDPVLGVTAKNKIINHLLATHFFHANQYEGALKAWSFGLKYLKIQPSLGLCYQLLKYQVSYWVKGA